jgi:DNA (cytosine-5)-methyltransferase 1
VTSLVLSLFPGIGLLDMAFEAEGFCVVRGPDLLWGGDVHAFHPPAGRFDGVIGGPPCQRFSRLAHLVEHVYGPEKLAPDLIPEFVRCVVAAAPRWFLMENVEGAPVPVVPGYATTARMVNNRWCGGVQNRARRFSLGVRGQVAPAWGVTGEAFEPAEKVPAVCASGSTWVPVRIGGSGKRKGGISGDKSQRYLAQAIAAQGLPPEYEAHLLAHFTVRGAVHAVGNGVPLPLGRAVARAVREWLESAREGAA